jgi:Flp pilus assembly protein TadG
LPDHKIPHAPQAARPGLFARLAKTIAGQRRGTVLVEFAIVGPVFFLMLFTAFDFAYGAFMQGVLDTAVQSTARQIQVGVTSGAGGGTAATTGAQLQSLYLCPNTLGLLNCGNLYVRVESIDTSATTACPGGYNAQDLYNATDGKLPESGNTLELGYYSNGAGYGTGTGGPTTCEVSSELTSTSPGYCVAAGSTESAPVLIILSAVYLSPSFLGRLYPNATIYNGSAVVARFSSAALITEGYSITGTATC